MTELLDPEEETKYLEKNSQQIIEAYVDTITTVEDIPQPFIDRWLVQNYRQPDIFDYQYELYKEEQRINVDISVTTTEQ